MHAEETDRRGTVFYVQQQMESSVVLADKLKVEPMKAVVD